MNRRQVIKTPAGAERRVQQAGHDELVSLPDHRPLNPTRDPTGRAPVIEVVPLTVSGEGGVPLAVDIRPAGAGPVDGVPPVLLVHGFGAAARSNWAGTGWLSGLHRAGIPTITVDLRGHGRSGKPSASSDYRLAALLADLRAVLAAVPAVLGPVSLVDLVGYSLGGRLVGETVAAAGDSYAYAARAPWSAGLPAVRRAVIGGYDGRPLFEGLDDVEFGRYREALAGRPTPDGVGSRTAAIATADRTNDLVALSALVAGLRLDREPLPAAAVGVPTLVVAGERDAITPDTRGWAAGLPQGEYLSIPGRTHISSVTAAAFRAAAVEFLLA